MNVQTQIKEYIASQPEPKRSDMQELHRIILKVMPKSKLWFLDGKNSENKVVSNPNIGYGSQTMNYAGGKTREFYQIGLSANTTGISVYIMGIDDKTYLAKTYGKKLGKASVSGYCIKFKALKDINIDVLEEAVQFGAGAQNKKTTAKKENRKKAAPALKVGSKCTAIGGTHKGKSGVVRDINTSKTGHVTITVVQASGVRFKTLAKNVEVV